jgi:dihydrofolate reductase
MCAPAEASRTSEGQNTLQRPRVVIIVAAAQNGIIGRDGQMPWRIPDDLKRFKTLTMGHPILMGRKTWQSIGRPLPGRENIVITRQTEFRAEGALTLHSLQEALDHAAAAGATDVFVIGGGDIYAQALPLAQVVHVTRVHAIIAGDVSFPSLDPSIWRETARESRSQTEPQPLSYDFVTYERR